VTAGVGRPRPALSALTGGIVVSSAAALYVVLIARGDIVPEDRAKGAFIASMLVVTGAFALVGAVWPRAYGRAVLLSAAGAAMVVWGLIGIFSIGLPLLLAAIPTWWAAARAARRAQGSAPAMEMAMAAVGVLVLSLGGLRLAG
jgi:hypothetical protein